MFCEASLSFSCCLCFSSFWKTQSNKFTFDYLPWLKHSLKNLQFQKYVTHLNILSFLIRLFVFFFIKFCIFHIFVFSISFFCTFSCVPCANVPVDIRLCNRQCSNNTNKWPQPHNWSTEIKIKTFFALCNWLTAPKKRGLLPSLHHVQTWANNYNTGWS